VPGGGAGGGTVETLSPVEAEMAVQFAMSRHPQLLYLEVSDVGFVIDKRLVVERL